MNWQPIETRPTEVNHITYLVANAKGQVAPFINGIIHNNVGSSWDWEYGEAVTHWMPLPPPPSEQVAAVAGEEQVRSERSERANPNPSRR